MSDDFYTVRDNSFANRGFPWIEKIVAGVNFRICGLCNKPVFNIQGDLEVRLNARKGLKWPDILGIGSGPMPFIVSNKFVESFKAKGLGKLHVGGRVRFVEPVPKALSSLPTPVYCWLDGEKLLGAKFDFAASGFTELRRCLECGNLLFAESNVSPPENQGKFPNALIDGTWIGLDLFTTDYSSTKFFCTRRILELARDFRLSNFRFLTVEQGADANSKGIDYLRGRF